MISIFSSPVMAASGQITNPPPNAVNGYTMLWNSTMTINNPFNSSISSTTVASQVWYKNDTQNNVTSVVGSVEMSIANSTLNQQVPTALINLLGNIPGLNFTSGTYWNLLMSCLLLSANTANITSQIQTTDDSIAFNAGTSQNYFVLSKANDIVIFTFSLTISNEWFTMNQAALESITTGLMGYITSFLTAWNTVVSTLNTLGGTLSNLLSSNVPKSIPQAASSQPSGNPTPNADVNLVTSELGGYYSSSSIPGYNISFVIAAIFVGFAAIFALNKKKIRK